MTEQRAGVRIRATRTGDEPSGKQMDFLLDLREEREIPLEVALQMSMLGWPPPDYRVADTMIDMLKPLPRKARPSGRSVPEPRAGVKREIGDWLDTHPPQDARGPLMREMRALLEKAAGVM